MPKHRKTYSASRARRTSYRVQDSTIGTHVVRRGAVEPRRNSRGQVLVRRARLKRALVAVAAVLVVAGIAVGAGIMAFRGIVGGEISLHDSDAADALVPTRLDDPFYMVFSVELGSVAEPLETDGPDVILLARLDSEHRSLSLVNVPPALQVTSDNNSQAIASLAAESDAAMIEALSTLAKVDISHFVKIDDEDDLKGLVDALGGVQVGVSQAIDDPHAGYLSIDAGDQRLDGEEALTFLRATNVELGEQDKLDNQLDFAAHVISQLFSREGNFDSRLELASPFIQTDLSLGDIDSIYSWLGGIEASEVSTAVLPGYFTAVTNVTGTDAQRFVSTSAEVAELVGKLESNERLAEGGSASEDLVSPSSFTVEVQNGTTIEGAASSTAELLKADGFKVGDVGNAETPVFDETIVVYRGDDPQGLARASTVIDALGVGRAVNGDAYYSFESDVLLIIGADNKPVS